MISYAFLLLLLLLLLSSSSIRRHWSSYCDFPSFFSSAWMCTCICVCVFVCRFPHTVTFVSLIQIYFSSTRAIDNERKKLFIKSANTLNRFYVIQSRASVAHLFWHITVYLITAQRYGPTHWTIFVFDWVCTATAWLSVWRSDNNGKWHMHLCM